jgi:hypothetical protein
MDIRITPQRHLRNIRITRSYVERGNSWGAQVDAQLSAKGWTKVDSNGSATISAFQSTHDQQTLEAFYDGFGGGWRWRGFGGDSMATTTTDVTKIGTLVVDIFDSQTQKLIWRGKQSDALSSNPDKNGQKLAKDLAGMFKHFPPSH